MARKDYFYSRRAGGGGFVRRPTREMVDYSKFTTKEYALLFSFFRWYPDIMEDICLGDRPDYTNSLMGRVTKRYLARYAETFTYGCRGYGKTSSIISDKCNKGILWPGEITGYYAPMDKQAAALASKAYAGYRRNTPLLAAHWIVNSDAQGSFSISTKNGSRLIMNIPRGMDTSGVVAEEAAQEDKIPFNFTEFNQIVLGTNRLQYIVQGAPDRTHIDSQIHYITSASRKENEAFTVYTQLRRDMYSNGSSYALSIPWQVVVLCRMKSIGYYKMLKKKLTAEQFMRECESRCTGNVENPIVRDAVLDASRRVMCMEDAHCQDPNAFYIVGYDVSSRDSAGNALSAFAVVKCERQYDTSKWDHYKKSLVYVTDMAPPSSAKEHARNIKKCWASYSMENGLSTFIVIDARQYGQSVVEALHEDMGDGLPPLCTTTHEEPYNALELPGAIPCIYPLMATGNSGRDPNSEMLDYIEREFENGNLRLLTGNVLDGIFAYKLKNGVSDDSQDWLFQKPYVKTNELCRQIANLQKKFTTTGWIEAPISRYIQKDMWSATLYACRFAQRLEHDELYAQNRQKSDWVNLQNDLLLNVGGMPASNARRVKRRGRMAIR